MSRKGDIQSSLVPPIPWSPEYRQLTGLSLGCQTDIGHGDPPGDCSARMARSLSDRIKLAEITRIEPMKLSARNMLPGKVVAVTKGATLPM